MSIKINWATLGQWALIALKAAPAVIQDVELVHGEAKTHTEKTQIAAEQLLVATNAIEMIDPKDAEAVEGLSQLGQAIIGAFNAQPPAADVPKAKK